MPHGSSGPDDLAGHRGQAHAMLTAAGQATGATDLWIAGAGTLPDT